MLGAEGACQYQMIPANGLTVILPSSKNAFASKQEMVGAINTATPQMALHF